MSGNGRWGGRNIKQYGIHSKGTQEDHVSVLNKASHKVGLGLGLV